MESDSLPLPLPDVSPQRDSEKRLWLGNLDQRLTEYQLLKILQPIGTIEKFDLLFHRSGPLEGQPRGYAFVTYKERECAMSAKDKLNGLYIGSKPLIVKWAHNISMLENEKSKVLPDIPALAGAKKEGVKNTSATIQAIEAKLRIMEKCSNTELDFSERPTLVGQPAVAMNNGRGSTVRGAPRGTRFGQKRSFPYPKQKRR